AFSASEIAKRSLPPNMAVPRRIRAGGEGRSPISASDVTLLPQPDSPTMQSVLPRSTLKETPSIRLVLAVSEKLSVKSSTCNRVSGVVSTGGVACFSASAEWFMNPLSFLVRREKRQGLPLRQQSPAGWHAPPTSVCA